MIMNSITILQFLFISSVTCIGNILFNAPLNAKAVPQDMKDEASAAPDANEAAAETAKQKAAAEAAEQEAAKQKAAAAQAARKKAEEEAAKKIDPVFENIKKALEEGKKTLSNDELKIDLSNKELTREDIEYLVNCFNNLKESSKKLFLKDLFLVLSNCKLDAESLKILFEFMSKNPEVITMLDLANSELEEEALKSLFKFMSENSVITMLDLSSIRSTNVVRAMSKFVNDEDSEETPEKKAISLFITPGMTIKIRDSKMDDNDLGDFLKIINTALQDPKTSLCLTLDLSGNQIKNVANFKEMKRWAKEIILNDNPLSQNSIKAIQSSDNSKFNTIPTLTSQPIQSPILNDLNAPQGTVFPQTLNTPNVPTENQQQQGIGGPLSASNALTGAQ